MFEVKVFAQVVAKVDELLLAALQAGFFQPLGLGQGGLGFSQLLANVLMNLYRILMSHGQNRQGVLLFTYNAARSSASPD